MNSETWIWVPNRSLGLFEFGSSVAPHASMLKRTLNEGDWADNSHIISYEVCDADVTVDAVNDAIVFITSWRFFYYKSTNLIGKNLRELEGLLETRPKRDGDSVEYDDGERKTPYAIDKLGLLIWTNDLGAASISCSDSTSEWDWSSPAEASA